MKIRTITTGFNLKVPLDEAQIRKVAEFTNIAKEKFEKNGYTVQTTRVATQPWEEYFKSKEQIIGLVKDIEKLIKKYNLKYFNIGTTHNPKNIPLIYEIIKTSSFGFCTSSICDDKSINFESSKETSKLIKKLSTISPDGFANLRFAALFNTKAGSPFYPAAYHKGQTSFAIGTENSDLVNVAFSKSKNIKTASSMLKQIMSI